ncbi:hypothetical protein GGE56_007635 [Rhizobium leguminosarum]|nr:hypothetical protein [Rhizobium leguminosarum]
MFERLQGHRSVIEVADRLHHDRLAIRAPSRIGGEKHPPPQVPRQQLRSISQFFGDIAGLADPLAFNGLSNGRQAKGDDARCARVHPPLPASHRSGRLSPHRHYGLLANGHRQLKLDLCRSRLDVPPPVEEPDAKPPPLRHRCSCCGGTMTIIAPLQVRRPAWNDSA